MNKYSALNSRMVEFSVDIEVCLQFNKYNSLFSKPVVNLNLKTITNLKIRTTELRLVQLLK